MTQVEATREIRELLSGRPGGVNRILRRFGKPVVDYATALIPDRGAPFDRMVEDILVDVISQARTSARAGSDEEVFEFVIEAALRTVRARYREVLEGEARPTKATSSYNFKEVLERTNMTQEQLTQGISEGRIRAVRADDQLKIKGESIPGLGERKAYHAYHVNAAERELLCLHYRLGFSPAVIARWAGVTPQQIEDAIGKAANHLSEGLARKRNAGADPKDTEMRRYIDGRMEGDETAKFERAMIKDKIAQRRLDELRSQSDSIRQLLDSEPYDLSSVAVNVRARNPHHALALPPVAALWLQVVGIAVIMLMFHSVGAYIAPPNVQVSAVAGTPELPPGGRLAVGEGITTPEGSQALLVLDQSNRVLMAPGSELKLLEPRDAARQVLGLIRGEIWGRFTSAGHAFVVEFPVADGQLYEVTSDDGADFDLVVGPGVESLQPDNLERERIRAFAAAFESGDRGLAARTDLRTFAGFRVGSLDEGLTKGDRLESIEGVSIRNAEDLAAAVRGLKPGESVHVTVAREDTRLAMALARVELPARAVLRVFHGSVNLGRPGAERILVNRGQWALLYDSQSPLVGLRGMEDYRVLRIGADERFKERLHWLNTESYPLRAENNLLVIDRDLRALAEGLEAMRALEIERDGPREITAFENTMRAAIQDAKQRIARGEPRMKGEGAASLSDDMLVKSEDDILGIIAHWRRQSATGVYPTLGNAAKTLSSPISRFRDDLEDRGQEITRSILLQDRIKELDEAIARQDAAISELKQSEFFDMDGARRKAIDDAIAGLEREVRAGADANSRIDLLKLKLNELDTKIDAERRKLAGLRKAVTDAEAALAQVDKQLAANVYTPEKLAAAELQQVTASAMLDEANARLASLKEEAAQRALELEAAEKAHAEAKKPIADLQAALDQADDALTDAITARLTSQAEDEKADAEVDRIKAELDAMAQDDPNRAAKQTELDAAEKAASETQKKLDRSISAASEARNAQEAAARALQEAKDVLVSKASAAEEARKTKSAAEKSRDEQDGKVKAAEKALKDADAALKLQQDARTARALLETRRTEVEAELTSARDNLQSVETKAATLDAEAQPKRDDLVKELAIVELAGKARTEIDARRIERGRYQAISDEIDLRTKDRGILAEERGQLAGSNLVLNFQQLSDEYDALSRRIDAYAFAHARALLEDASFSHEQKAAQDRFREAAEVAGRQAGAILDKFCPAYTGNAYAPFTGERGAKLRTAVLGALWKLYYDAGLERTSDSDENLCYYVAVRSGAGNDALARLDTAWQAYLSAALGKQNFEAIVGLSPDGLQVMPNKKD
ncbi:MAG: hypothetical protein H6841_03315 [Planctomycetes bacterium]|nr:hypothetical protein [Planctomycetota bacterium]MCB9934148.1 hypothetical protein [Planctomycetota bacterium]